MKLGSNLFNARKKSGLSQEEVAEKLGVSRQTISKWELDETIPDIYQSKRLANLYHLSLDELIEFDIDLKEIERVIENTSEETESKVNWTKVWGKKYPVLTTYKQKVDIKEYSIKIREMLDSLKNKYGYSDVDACLVLKDILANEWKNGK
ncbi:MAG: helix-turn-helix transcriptional regulator [Clostridium sp.]